MSEAASAVRWLLQQAEPEARRVAVQQIAKVAGPEAADLLLRALGDEDWRVRKEAGVIAPALEPRREVVAALIAALEESVNIGLRNAAVEALVAIGADAIGAAIEAMPRLDPDARKLAVEVLGGLADERSTLALVRALDDDDVNVRVAAAEALGSAARAGDDARDLATKSLVSALSSQHVFLKIAALESLARLEVRLPWRTFEPYAHDPLLRRYAIAAACGSGEPEAVHALAQATGDPSPTVAREAIVALGSLVSERPPDADLVEVAREAFRKTQSGQANTRTAAIDTEDMLTRSGALPLLGLLRQPQDVDLLVDALGEDVAERADLAFRIYGPEAVPPLLAAATRKRRSSVRAAALQVAASMKGADRPIVLAALRSALDDPSAEVVGCAVERLGAMGDAEDLHRVAALVGHSNERVAAAAANALWALASSDVPAARALVTTSEGTEAQVLSCIVLGAIASIEPLREEDLRALQRALAHERPPVRRAAIEALAQAGGDTAAGAVTVALADEDHEVQLAAVRALGRLGSAGPLLEVVKSTHDPVLTAAALRALGGADPARSLEAVGKLVEQPDGAVASAALEAVGHLESLRVLPSYEDVLFTALDHPDPQVVKLALPLLAGQRTARALAGLGRCLDHASWDVRRAAAELLGQDKASSARALLRGRYERERDPVVRDAIAAAVSLRPIDREEWIVTAAPRSKDGK